jgi:hypothetical protein
MFSQYITCDVAKLEEGIAAGWRADGAYYIEEIGGLILARVILEGSRDSTNHVHAPLVQRGNSFVVDDRPASYTVPRSCYIGGVASRVGSRERALRIARAYGVVVYQFEGGDINAFERKTVWDVLTGFGYPRAVKRKILAHAEKEGVRGKEVVTCRV